MEPGHGFAPPQVLTALFLLSRAVCSPLIAVKPAPEFGAVESSVDVMVTGGGPNRTAIGRTFGLPAPAYVTVRTKSAREGQGTVGLRENVKIELLRPLPVVAARFGYVELAAVTVTPAVVDDSTALTEFAASGPVLRS